MSALNTTQIAVQLRTTPHWTRKARTLVRVYELEGCVVAVDFVKWVAKKAEKMNHHPDIDIRFNRVTLRLTTHDEGGITEKDFVLARQCDEVFSKLFAP